VRKIWRRRGIRQVVRCNWLGTSISSNAPTVIVSTAADNKIALGADATTTRLTLGLRGVIARCRRQGREWLTNLGCRAIPFLVILETCLEIFCHEAPPLDIFIAHDLTYLTQHDIPSPKTKSLHRSPAAFEFGREGIQHVILGYLRQRHEDLGLVVAPTARFR